MAKLMIAASNFFYYVTNDLIYLKAKNHGKITNM